MKRWQKFAILAATPSVSILHSRWIAHLLVHPWDSEAQAAAFGAAILTTIAAGIVTAVTWEM